MFVKMKIKCFSKRKLNVRISKTKIKCAILGFSQNCCILGKSRKNWSNLAEHREWVAPQMSFLAKPMRITGICMQKDDHCYVINVIHGMSMFEGIVVTLIEEATHSFTRLLM